MFNTENVLIIMNGPTVNRLNWDIINSELLNNKLTVIVTNGFLSTDKIIDSPNVIYIVNDPLIELILNGNISNIEDPKTKLFLINNYHFDNDHLDALKFDIISCNKLLQTKLTKIAMRSNAYCENLFNKKRVVNFDFTILEKLLIKFCYKWHQNGGEPVNFFNKYGFKTFPYESRFIKYFIKFKFLNSFWYKLNFCQTPNTFYRALDLAIKSNSKNILFIGRNSQIDDWLSSGKKNNYSVEVKYSYFFTNKHINLSINNFQSIIREIYYSSQYIKMLNSLFTNKNFLSLEGTYCYKDYVDDDFTFKYFS